MGYRKDPGKQKIKRKKIPALDKYAILSISVMLVYTIVEFIVSSITGISHDTLTTCLYGAFGGELFMLCMIKRLKLKKEDVL